MTLGERILKYRAKEGISQAEMAKRCRISLQAINYIERGRQKPSRLTTAKIEMVIAEEGEEA